MKKRKKPFLTIKTRIFQSPKFTFFFKGINPCFWPKMLFFLYFDFIKIRLEIMLSDFQEKKETCFDYKKRNFSKSKKSHFFKGVNPCSWTKNANFSFTLIWSKIRLEITVNNFVKKKNSFFTIKKKTFWKSQKSLFFP